MLKASCRAKRNLWLNISLLVRDAWFCLPTMNENLSMAEQKGWEDLDDGKPLSYQPRTVSFVKDYVFKVC